MTFESFKDEVKKYIYFLVKMEIIFFKLINFELINFESSRFKQNYFKLKNYFSIFICRFVIFDTDIQA